MNRLVIIGNGFDLAHGLPTSYGHFIDAFWSNFKNKVKTEEYKKFVYTHDLFDQYYSNYGIINNFNDFKSNIDEYINDHTGFYFNKERLMFYTSKGADREVIFKFENEFFKIICNESTTINWSGIEAIYYNILKGIAIPEKNIYKYPNSVQRLNEEFEDVKKLLVNYLEKNICEKYSFTLDDTNEILKSLEEEINNSDIEKNETYVTYFLSFNYTPTARLYYEYLKNKLYKTEVNYIHGELSNDKNPYIIFGYGDDEDNDYGSLKEKGNVFLNNLKNHEYGEEENLVNLIAFMNSNKFRVLIMGHSCETSDKFLLSQIFENPNCDKIKIYYRPYDNGSNNYKDLSKNISRHFKNDRIATTTKIDIKKKSDPLFQKIRFEQKNDPQS
ncbi:AbiH family protein [Flavobacterium sp. UBA7682]|uniref:AbiH family protein n=1 Tax=Flavobacterium sp. UBA7682 TaxID=1946560 RepID=UPI0025C57065|nr:AbiH family protein [Flavobacterium sp. UBA7682]